jgi:hypothetical protein
MVTEVTSRRHSVYKVSSGVHVTAFTTGMAETTIPPSVLEVLLLIILLSVCIVPFSTNELRSL